MNQLELDEQRYRITMAICAILVAALGIGAASIVFSPAEAESTKVLIGDVLFDRSNHLFPFTIQDMMWIMFFVGLGEIWVRINRSNKEISQFSRRLLPEQDDVMLRVRDLAPIYRAINDDKKMQHFFVPRLIKRIVLQFQGSQSISQASSLMNSSLELMQHEIDLKFSMLRYLVWLIPTLGFIGTVIGIALALSQASHMPDVTESDEIRKWLGLMTIKLGLAFYTTLMSLLMSSVLVFLLHLSQSREEMALNSTGQYCLDNLINRLYEEK